MLYVCRHYGVPHIHTERETHAHKHVTTSKHTTKSKNKITIVAYLVSRYLSPSKKKERCRHKRTNESEGVSVLERVHRRKKMKQERRGQRGIVCKFAEFQLVASTTEQHLAVHSTRLLFCSVPPKKRMIKEKPESIEINKKNALPLSGFCVSRRNV